MLSVLEKLENTPYSLLTSYTADDVKHGIEPSSSNPNWAETTSLTKLKHRLSDALHTEYVV